MAGLIHRTLLRALPGAGAATSTGSAGIGHGRPRRHARDPGHFLDQLLRQHVPGPKGGAEPLEGEHAGVDRPLAAAARQLQGVAQRLSRTLRIQRARAR